MPTQATLTESAMKNVTITIMNQNFVRQDWYFDFNGNEYITFLERLAADLKPLGYDLICRNNADTVITVKSYADLLNCIKVSTDNSMGNHCVGHCLGKSERLDIMEDIEAAVRRVVFAPETIPPANEFRKVCHNCGCGC